MKVAVVTPYHKENDALLRRCIESVRQQTKSCMHYLVSDGFPQEWVENAHENIRHLRLDREHADFGNTPRALGAYLAIAEGADAISFLDADNSIDKDHVEMCLREARKPPRPDIVVAQRRIVLPDGTPVPVPEERGHIDTNCYFLLANSFGTILNWILQPKPLTAICDRIYLQHILAQNLTIRRCPRPTVTYYGNWTIYYELASRTPPPGAKSGEESNRAVTAWWRNLSAADKDAIRKRIAIPGFELK